MIIGNSFAFGHIPKTGGDATHVYFHTLAKYQPMTIDSIRLHYKHTNFFNRLGYFLISPQKKFYILSFRKLDQVAKSYLNAMQEQQKQLEVNPDRNPYTAKYFKEYKMALPTFRPENAMGIDFDSWITKFEEGGYKINYWFRQEFLLQDIIKFAREELEIPVNENSFEENLVARTEYNKEPFFSEAQLEELHKKNPKWTAIQKSLY